MLWSHRWHVIQTTTTWPISGAPCSLDSSTSGGAEWIGNRYIASDRSMWGTRMTRHCPRSRLKTYRLQSDYGFVLLRRVFYLRLIFTRRRSEQSWLRAWTSFRWVLYGPGVRGVNRAWHETNVKYYISNNNYALSITEKQSELSTQISATKHNKYCMRPGFQLIIANDVTPASAATKYTSITG